MADPILKWPGGKRWFLENYQYLLPTSYNTYIEPFVGSGALFFYLEPNNSILGDLNADLVNLYNSIKLNPDYINRSLKYHQKKHNKEYYYKTREKKGLNKLQQASRMLYLNRTCFNGIYRVNRNGEFNVPIGSKNNVILDNDDFNNTSRILRKAQIVNEDFEVLINKAQKNDFVFADPPYTVRHNLNGFIKYNEKLFSWEDQERLANSLKKAKKRGAKLIVTNANHSSIRKLYKGAGFNFIIASRFSSISASSKSRKMFDELIITSY